VILPSGRFQMGGTEDDDEKPIHEVRIDSTLAVGKYPVTFEAYDRFCQATGFRRPEDQGWGRVERPVIIIDWHEAQEYCDWLAFQTGRDYRLPSEAEWEYACRAGTRTRFSFGDNESDLGRFAWFSGNSQGKTQPVGRKRPNPWGLHDTQGNVWEWCRDQWHENYQKAPNDGSSWETGGDSKYRVLRGGSWCGYPFLCRPAYRGGGGPADRGGYVVGFRVVCLVAARTL